MPFGIGPLELIILLVVAMMVFGVGKLPQVSGAIGKSIREFRKAQTEVDELVTHEPMTEGNEREVKQS